MKLLEGLREANPENPRDGIGMDCSIVPLSRAGLFMVSTTDFFYPLVEDPYMQGRIACANVLSDLYSLGVSHCDNMLMTLAASRDMKDEHRHIVTKQMIMGFSDLAKEAGTNVTGGQTVLNPWPIIGGVAMSCCLESDMIRPESAEEGDVIVLTKPLGTQLAVNAHQWLHQPGPKWQDTEKRTGITKSEALRAYAVACESMSRLNKNGALMMHKYGAHCATDVTGFGIMGHCENLAQNQKRSDLIFEISALPVIRSMMSIDALNPHLFKLAMGLSAETSGGLLVALNSLETAQKFIAELKTLDKQDAWVVGSVKKTTEPQKLSRAVLVSGEQISSCCWYFIFVAQGYKTIEV